MRLPFAASGMIPQLVNLLFPSTCPVCRTSTDTISQAPFCIRCWQSITYYRGPSCCSCGVPLASAHADRCGPCRESPPAFSRAVSFGKYEGTLAAAIHHFKFLGLRRLAAPLAELLASVPTDDCDAIIPVPLSIGSLRIRGFNQALLLAHHLSKLRGIPLMMDLLIKILETPPQVGLSAQERAANVKKAFACTGRAGGLNVILLDDVMTTGATVNACAKQLLRAGARNVQVLTLARAGEM